MLWELLNFVIVTLTAHSAIFDMLTYINWGGIKKSIVYTYFSFTSTSVYMDLVYILFCCIIIYMTVDSY